MDMELIYQIGDEAMQTAIDIAGPFLGAILIAGLAMGIMQAATHINDAVLGFVPKLIAFALVSALLGATLFNQLLDFATTMFLLAGSYQ